MSQKETEMMEAEKRQLTGEALKQYENFVGWWNANLPRPKLEWHEDQGGGSWVHCLECGAEMLPEQFRLRGHQCEPLPESSPKENGHDGG